ncbi:MAG: tetratricopeptide repeat protein [Desulfobacterales bacterium]|nr:tetratricopeptide repeat protein [Desulfobacterales bacterium]
MAEQIKNKALFDKAAQAFAKREYNQSITLFTMMIAEDPEDTLAWVSRGAAHMRLDNLDAALEDFNRAIGLRPKQARSYHLRGLIYEKQGALDKALDDFSKAIALDPEYGAALYSRAALFTKMGDGRRAQEDAEAFTMLTEKKVGEYANENNIWRSQHLTLEEGGITDPIHR